MATRIYLSSPGHSQAYPIDGSVFTSFGSAVRYLGSVGVRHPAQATSKGVAEVSSSRLNTPLAMFIVDNLAAQTISGTMKGQIRALESAAAADLHLMCTLQVMSKLFVVRGTLYASTNGGTTISATPGNANYELDTVATNRKLPPGWTGSGVSLTSVDAQAGDSLVLTVGYRAINTVTTSYTGTVHIGSESASTDLPEDETTTADYHPWIELSHNLSFLTDEPQLSAEEKMFYVTQPVPPNAGQLWPRGAGQ